MWPFKNKSGGYLAERTSESYGDIDNGMLINRGRIMSELKELQAWRDVAETFEYMGRSMLVIGYSKPVHPWLSPDICTRYCDNNGQIHELRLNYHDVKHLMGRVDAASKAKE